MENKTLVCALDAYGLGEVVSSGQYVTFTDRDRAELAIFRHAVIISEELERITGKEVSIHVSHIDTFNSVLDLLSISTNDRHLVPTVVEDLIDGEISELVSDTVSSRLYNWFIDKEMVPLYSHLLKPVPYIPEYNVVYDPTIMFDAYSDDGWRFNYLIDDKVVGHSVEFHSVYNVVVGEHDGVETELYLEKIDITTDDVPVITYDIDDDLNEVFSKWKNGDRHTRLYTNHSMNKGV